MQTQVNSDTVRVTLASLLRVIEQLGACALGGRAPDIDDLERDVRSTLFAHLAGVGPAETAAGVALAHTLVEPILRGLRERAEPRKLAGETGVTPPGDRDRLN